MEYLVNEAYKGDDSKKVAVRGNNLFVTDWPIAWYVGGEVKGRQGINSYLDPDQIQVLLEYSNTTW
eukprot:10905804-Karenia_brevis.AAC.1